MSLLHREMKVLEAIENLDDLHSMAMAIKDAGLSRELDRNDPFTLFAPVNRAFDDVPHDKLNDIYKDPSKLAILIRYHVADERFWAKDARDRKEVRTLHGGFLDVDTNGGFRVNGRRVVREDIECRNGVIHVIDAILFPPDIS